MRRFGIGLLCAIGGYFVFLFAGYWCIELFTPPHHERSMDALFSSVFLFGPIGAVLGFIAGCIFGGKRRDVSPKRAYSF
jgi:hypothetical protein